MRKDFRHAFKSRMKFLLTTTIFSLNLMVIANAFLPIVPQPFATTSIQNHNIQSKSSIAKLKVGNSNSNSNNRRKRNISQLFVQLNPSVYETIQSGKIAIIPNFLPQDEITSLKSDAQNLWTNQKFSTDALASYGSNGKFDPSKDRAVLRLNQWKDSTIGEWTVRQRFGNRMADLRTTLAYNLNRPNLDNGLSTTLYGNGSTEISYTRFGPGAFLKRHVDEHHEELKGPAGWSMPTRRSVSWLIYLNDKDWNGDRDGGQLRCFQRRDPPVGAVGGGTNGSYGGGGSPLGAMPNGDLQIGWLRATVLDPYERPVYLDARKHDHGNCAMYVVADDGRTIQYITKDFQTNPILYVAGSEQLAKKVLIRDDRKDLVDRFHFIEPPKSKIGDLFQKTNSGSSPSVYSGEGEDAAFDEVLKDVDPIGGTLVLFDSVSLPHEVLATKKRERWATSGWFHEDQQPVLQV